jgi:EpsI family protein
VSTHILNKPTILHFILFAFVLILYWPTTTSFYNLWIASNSTTYSHGGLLFLICIYYIYKRWRAISHNLSARPSVTGTFLLFGTSFSWYLASIANIQIIQQILYVLLFLFIFWSLMGYRAALYFVFPLLLIICAIPIWELINEHGLQVATAAGVGFLLEITGIASYREGAMIFVPAGTFLVAENCSGMRQLVVAIPIALLYANINQFRLLPTIIYVFVAIILSFLINTLRIFIVVIAGQMTNMQHYFVREDHVTLGWALFGIAMFIFIYLSRRYIPAAVKVETPKGITQAKQRSQEDYSITKPQPSILFLVIIFIALFNGPVLANLRSVEQITDINKLTLPSNINEWRLDSDIDDEYKPVFHTADTFAIGHYVNNKEVMYTYIACYLRQEQGKELISGLNQLYDRTVWQRARTKEYVVNIDNKKLIINEMILRSVSGGHKLVWYWYYLSGTRTNSQKLAKLIGIWKELTNQKGAAVFVVANNITSTDEASREIMKQYLEQSLDKLENSVDQVLVK